MNRITPVVKYLLIINVLLFLAMYVFDYQFHIDLVRFLGLHYPGSNYFQPYQFVTHMFMHGGWAHIFFNMYALWMFGTAIENTWGGKRFLFYYLFTGLGAAALHIFVNYLIFVGITADITAFSNTPSPELFKQFIDAHRNGFRQEYISYLFEIYQNWSLNHFDMGYATRAFQEMNNMLVAMQNIPTVGASGAIYGILLAFGMMYPNAQLMLIIPPIPLKAKWLVIGLAAVALILGVSQPGSRIAHFAHLGGMLFGYLLIRYWIARARRR